MSPAGEAHNDPILTPKQLAILTSIRDYERDHGYSPTLQELADRFGVSKITIHEHIAALRKKGLLKTRRYRARSVKLTPQASFPDEKTPVRMPLLGRIAAGAPIEAVENPEMLDLAEILASRGTVFALQVRGNSMIDDHIRNGDYVIVERRETAGDGETVVALLDNGEATLKRFYREGSRIRLQPANASMSPIYVTRARIQGIVIGIIRRMGTSFQNGS